MLRTDKEIVMAGLTIDWSDMKSWIVKRVGIAFREYPDYFFTEHDIHSVLYDIAKEELQLYGVPSLKTGDKHEVFLVHHEYPTPFRCDMEGYKFEKKDEKPYRRGHYDLSILNPAFVNKNELDVVCAKDFQVFKTAMEKMDTEPLIWVCEVLFFPRVKTIPNDAIQRIKQDALKVKETLRHKVGSSNRLFCKMGSVLIFTSHTAEEATNLRRQVKKLRDALDL